MQTRVPYSGGPLPQPLITFLRIEAADGLALMASAVLALIVANSPLAVYYGSLLDTPLAVSVGTFGISKPLLLWVNDGLMAVFFFLVGMELKREILDGHLSSLHPWVAFGVLPVFAFVNAGISLTCSGV